MVKTPVNIKRVVASILFFCILCTLCTQVVACRNTNNSINEITPNSIIEKKTNVTDESQPMTFEIKNAVFLKGTLEVSEDSIIDVPPNMDIYDNEFILIDQDISDELIKNLYDNGWGKHTFEHVEKGGYFIKSKEKGSGFLSSNQLMEISQAFINESGLYEFLYDMGIKFEYEIEGNEGQYVAFCYLLKDDRRTGSYIRMIFEGNKICPECKMYLYDSEIIGNLPTILFEEALDRAFYIFEHSNIKEDHNNYIIKNTKIKYVNGLPYYNFDAFGINTRTAVEGYALAVYYDDLSINPDYLKKYYDFTE
ncbi:hypothetical protein ES707_20179 [subsurface metagenome]